MTLTEISLFLILLLIIINLNLGDLIMSNKIKTIEYSRFLSEEELSAVRGGRAFNKLTPFSCSPFELCSSTMVFTTCTVN